MATEETQVVDFDDRYYWSLSQLAKAFGPARETISRRLFDAGVKAARQRVGHDVYHIADAAPAILAGELPKFEPQKDPDDYPPKERLDWYRSENEKTKHQREAGVLVPISEVSREMASVVKICVRTLETLPDLLEMKCALSSNEITLIERECDHARDQLASALSAD